MATLEAYFGYANSLAPLASVGGEYYQTNFDGSRSQLGSSSYAGALLSTDPYPDGIQNALSPNALSCGTNCITDQAIEQEVRAAQTTPGWSNVDGNVYVVLTGPNESICDNAHGPFGVGATCSVDGPDSELLCAYHAATSDYTAYAAVSYPQGNSGCQPPSLAAPSSASPNGDVIADSAVAQASHELAEVLTDPFGQGWCDAAGYQSIALIGPSVCQDGEIADKCGASWALETYGGYQFVVQELWDNRLSGCTR